MMGPPPGTPGSSKIGFTTYMMWGLCAVVVGVCYAIEQNEIAKKPPAPPALPNDVSRVLDSGAWLMKDGSIQNPGAKR